WLLSPNTSSLYCNSSAHRLTLAATNLRRPTLLCSRIRKNRGFLSDGDG
ncbi:hypothetical protein LINPERHAP1_LOCUS36230, partial [Linum perenne]